jgi:hypothetical protein
MLWLDAVARKMNLSQREVMALFNMLDLSMQNF